MKRVSGLPLFVLILLVAPPARATHDDEAPVSAPGGRRVVAPASSGPSQAEIRARALVRALDGKTGQEQRDALAALRKGLEEGDAEIEAELAKGASGYNPVVKNLSHGLLAEFHRLPEPVGWEQFLDGMAQAIVRTPRMRQTKGILDAILARLTPEERKQLRGHYAAIQAEAAEVERLDDMVSDPKIDDGPEPEKAEAVIVKQLNAAYARMRQAAKAMNGVFEAAAARAGHTSQKLEPDAFSDRLAGFGFTVGSDKFRFEVESNGSFSLAPVENFRDDDAHVNLEISPARVFAKGSTFPKEIEKSIRPAMPTFSVQAELNGVLGEGAYTVHVMDDRQNPNSFYGSAEAPLSSPSVYREVEKYLIRKLYVKEQPWGEFGDRDELRVRVPSDTLGGERK